MMVLDMSSMSLILIDFQLQIAQVQVDVNPSTQRHIIDAHLAGLAKPLKGGSSSLGSLIRARIREITSQNRLQPLFPSTREASWRPDPDLSSLIRARIRELTVLEPPLRGFARPAK